MRAAKVRSSRYYLEGLVASKTKKRMRSGGPTAPWFYFLHIEKTAGTSLLYSLYRSFSQSEVFPNVHQRRTRYGKWHPHWDDVAHNYTSLLFDDMRVLVGHFGMEPLDATDTFEQKPQVITFLRDPGQRLLSAVEFNQQPGRRYDGLDLDEILAKHAWREGSMQAQAFGYDHDEDNVDEVLDNFRRVDFVGFVETYDESLAKLSAFLGLPAGLQSERRNASARKLKPTAEQNERITQLTKPDRALYDFARNNIVGGP